MNMAVMHLLSVVEPPQPVEGKMTITDEQRAQLEAFDKERGFILSHGELKEQLFERIKELGFGNGGVVLKMEHKPTGVIMARKVLTFLYLVALLVQPHEVELM